MLGIDAVTFIVCCLMLLLIVYCLTVYICYVGDVGDLACLVVVWFVTDLFVVVWGLFCCLFWFAVLVSCLFGLLVICDGWLLIVGV